MQIILYRNHKNRLYTEGELRINGSKTTFVVESTTNMLPEGIYSLQIVKLSARKQKLCVIPESVDGMSINNKPNSIDHLWTIGVEHSWIGCKKNKVIAIGEPFFPGAVNNASTKFERIIDRITKCMERKEHIMFIITEERCQINEPIMHWLQDSMHGCLSSNRRVEVDENGVAYVYDHDVLVKTIYPMDESIN